MIPFFGVSDFGCNDVIICSGFGAEHNWHELLKTFRETPNRATAKHLATETIVVACAYATMRIQKAMSPHPESVS